MPVSDTRLKMIHDATQNGSEIQQIISLMRNGWPETGKNLLDPINAYFSTRNELSLDGLLLYRNRVVIPASQRREILDKLHTSYQDFVKAKNLQHNVYGGWQLTKNWQ